MLRIEIKTFDQFDVNSLYKVLQLRSEIFVVEQDCVYQDLDGKDQKALHVLGYKNDELIGYTRIFKPGDYFNESSIGRVAVVKEARAFGYGKDIVKASIKAIEDYFTTNSIQLSAQIYLLKFYKELGFNPVGESYLEDGIPHIKMIKK